MIQENDVSGWFDTIWADDLPSRAVTVYMYLRSRADREEMLPLRPHDQQGYKAVHEHGTPGAG